jgi:teichuronic acid exporter
MRKNIIQGLKWNTIDQIFSLGSKFLVTIVLSRLLEPKDFGLLAMIFAFTIVADVLIDAGFRNSIIQEKEPTDFELSSIFWLNMAIGLFFTLLIFFSSYGVAAFYKEPLLQPVMAVISLLYVISPLSLIQGALLTKKLKFKALTISQVASKVASGTLGISMAYTGWGYWSLVGSVLAGGLLRNVMLWFQSSWRPSFHFRFSDLQKYWKVSSNILYSNILFNVVNRIDYVMIGKFFSPALLGMYSRAKENAFIPGTIIANVIRNTFFGIFSNLKSDLTRLRKMYVDASHLVLISLTIIFSSMIIFSNELILIVFGSKWISMNLMFQCSCIYVFIYCNTILRVYLLNALGRTDIDFRIGMFAHPLRLAILLIPFFIGFKINVYYFIFINTLFVFTSICIYEFYIRKILMISYRESFRFLPLLISYAAIAALILVFVPLETIWMSLLVKIISFGVGSAIVLGLYFKQLLPLINLVRNKHV